MERLHADNWTLSPAVYSYSTNWRPGDFVGGALAINWEFTDPSTLVYHLHQGIHWQDLPPVNGREFTADDVVWHWDRYLGLGSSFKGSPYLTTVTAYQALMSVTATDKYTVVFKWKIPNPEYITETIQGAGGEGCMEAHEVVEKWGSLDDWHNALGTGPFILKDFVSGSSALMVRNPNYWGHDERYPQNQLPYINSLKVLVIPNQATALAGLRTGKIDFIDAISLQNAQQIQKTNPEILQLTYPAANCLSMDPRNDTKPFTDIRVRKALQMALDLPTIASNYYGGYVDAFPSPITSRYEIGWAFQYSEWPQDLKDEYAYNPTKAKQLLSDAGYPTGFKTNVVADAAGDMDLLQIVKSYFAAVGIDMEIKAMESAAWSTFVRGRKHDQLAASSNGFLGLSFEPTRQLQRLQTGYSTNWLAVSDPTFDTFLPKGMAATSVDGVKQVVRTMDEYVARQHFIISLVQPSFFALYQPWFKGYSGQNMSVSGAGSSPLFLGFYASRFWIDQNVKKSLGH
jgi:peptide/nickel transport system substrate-binding protein